MKCTLEPVHLFFVRRLCSLGGAKYIGTIVKGGHILGSQFLSFVERFIVLCLYFWESPLSEVPLYILYICMYMHMCTYIHTYYVSTHDIRTYILHTYVCEYIRTYVRMYIQTNKCTHIHMKYVRTYVCTFYV